MLKVQKRQFYYSTDKFRNVDMAFNLGYNEIAVSHKSNLNPVAKRLFVINNRVIINQIKNIYHMLLEALENNDIKYLEALFDEKLYYIILRDMSKYRSKLIFVNKHTKNNLLQKVNITPLNYFELFNVNIDRKLNKNLLSVNINKTQAYFDKQLNINYSTLSEDIQISSVLGKELGINKENSNLNNIFNSEKSKEIRERIENKLKSRLENEYLFIYLTKQLGSKPNDAQIKQFKALKEESISLKVKGYNYNKSMLNNASNDEIAFINYFRDESKYIEEQSKSISLIDFYNCVFPEEFANFKESNQNYFNYNFKNRQSDNCVIVLDVLIESTRRIKFQTDENKQSLGEVEITNDFVNKDEIDETRENFIQKHVFRVEYYKPSFAIKFFNQPIKLKVTDIDMILEGNKHFNN